MRARFDRTAVDTHDARGGAKKCARNRKRFSFRLGGEFEQVGVIARRAQTRFGDFQA